MMVKTILWIKISKMEHNLKCYQVVKKNCFKFIKSQETTKEKFKNKEKMIKSFLIPLSYWIAKKTQKKKPLFIGLAGGQGTGKTTISTLMLIILKKYFKFKVFKISIDDFYKTRNERLILSKKIHPMLKVRGAPGTHDVGLILNFFKQVKNKRFKKIKLPRFDKSIDDRCKKKLWYKLDFKPDIIIFEGWCVGAKAEKKINLIKPINRLEKISDKKGIWRHYVNDQLNKSYKKFFDQIDMLLYLKAQSFNLLKSWRLKQEKKLHKKVKNKKKNLRVMSKNEVLEFMMTYQRITQQMLKTCMKFSSVILHLNKNHQIKSLSFK